MALNEVLLQGNIVFDPELKQTTSGKSIIRIRIAQNSRVDGQTRAEFFDLTAFSERAEFISRNFGKGDPILIRASIHPNSYEKNGVTCNTYDLIVEAAEFCGGRAGNIHGSITPPTQENASQKEYGRDTARFEPQPTAPTAPKFDVKDIPTSDGVNYDDLPF